MSRTDSHDSWQGGEIPVLRELVALREAAPSGAAEPGSTEDSQPAAQGPETSRSNTTLGGASEELVAQLTQTALVALEARLTALLQAQAQTLAHRSAQALRKELERDIRKQLARVHTQLIQPEKG